MNETYDGRIRIPGKVKQREWRYIKRRRKAVEESDQAPLVGLALSGGGVRSATFCLGVLQSLAGRNALRIVDYMCTVSGGGYIGACFSSLFTIPKSDADHNPQQHEDTDRDPSEWKKQAQGNSRFDLHNQFPFLLPDQMHHLRKHGDFLMLGRSKLRREFIRGLGTTIIGMLCTLATYFLIMVALMGAFVAYTSALTQGQVWQTIAHSTANGDTAFKQLDPSSMRIRLLIVFVLGFASALAASGVAFLAQEGWQRFLAKPRSGETVGVISERRGLTCFTIAMLIVLLVPLIAPGQFGDLTRGKLQAAESCLAGLWFPLAFTVGALVAATFLYVFCALWDFSWTDRIRSLVGAMHGVCLYGTLLSLLLVATVLLIWWSEKSYQQLPLIVGGLVSLILSRLGVAVEQRKRSSLTDTLIRVAVRCGLTLAVIVFVLGTAVLSAHVVLWIAPVGDYLKSGLLITAVAFPLTLVATWLIDFNRIGLHYFYHDRLVDAYLRTEARSEEISRQCGLTVVRDDARLRLENLHDNGGQQQNPAPYHLVLCSLNLAGSRDLARKDRKSDHFIFSREYCGSSTTGYVRTKRYRNGKTELASAMTVSGAAASSGMGYYTSFAQAFAATLFNVRLGVWVINPRIYDERNNQVLYPWDSKPPRKWVEQQPWNGCLLRCARGWGERFVLWPIYLWREMFAMTDPRSLLVNISDGGHTGDNIGIYPLLQRRCRLIIACDGEADPNYDFGSLASAIRQINIDENVEIDVDLGRIRPLEPGNAAKGHYLIGKIHYPQNPSGDDWRPSPLAGHQSKKDERNKHGDNGTQRLGWILYLKSSYTNQNEPAAVRSYAAKHPHFPHETTLDQLFSDDQFEAYRAMGHYITDKVLKGVKEAQKPGEDRPDAQAIIDWCEKTFEQGDTGSG